jgi:hypothetical protein
MKQHKQVVSIKSFVNEKLLVDGEGDPIGGNLMYWLH